MKKTKISLYLCLAALTLVFWSLLGGEAEAAAKGVNVDYHSQAEIAAYLKAANIDVEFNDCSIKFSKNPSFSGKQSAGTLSSETLNKALNTLNAVRYIAGISDVSLNKTYNKQAQAATFVNAYNLTMSHNPAYKAGLDVDIYNLGRDGARSSNLAMTSWKTGLDYAIVQQWMEDGDAGNIALMGHRRWVLNPAMKETGFGGVYHNTPFGYEGSYFAMYAFDQNNKESDAYGVMWPAQEMPINWFGSYYPWTISMGYPIDMYKVNVSLTRKRDNKTWNFSFKKSDGYFNVDNQGYGQEGCIVFRPDGDGIAYEAGDSFSVKITGLKEDVNYTVNFFDPTKFKYNSLEGKTKKINGITYKITKDIEGKTGTAKVTKGTDKGVIPDTIKVNGRTFKVSAIADKAFSNSKVKSVTIGKNITTIGAKAFYKCRKLNSIKIKTTKLKTSSVGSNAFAYINAKAKIVVPKSKYKAYKTLLAKKGIKGKKQKITK